MPRPPRPEIQSRFGEAPLALDRSTQGLSFVRCAACAQDNSRFVEVCQRCGSSLRTAEQRAFDARFVEETRALQEGEEKQTQALKAGREEEEGRQAAGRREAVASLEQAAVQRTREEQDAHRRSPALRLLRRISDPRRRLVVLLAVISLLVLPWVLTDRHSELGLWSRILSVLAFFSFASPRWWAALTLGRFRQPDRWRW